MVAINLVTLKLFIFTNTWPMNLQPPCTSYIGIIRWIVLMNYYSLFVLSASSESDAWIIYLALGLRSRDFLLSSFQLSANTSIVRYNNFLKPSDMAFILYS